MRDDIPRKPMGREEKGPMTAFLEEHFTCKELAKRWHLSESTVFKLFAQETGVVKVGERSTRKRTKISIRIPLSVAERVYRSLIA